MIEETNIIPEYLKKKKNSHLSPRAYWSVLKNFLNNEKLWLFQLCSMKIVYIEQIFLFPQISQALKFETLALDIFIN